MKVDSTDPRPAYAQIADSIRASIEGGQLSPGTRLPAGRELAEQFGVAPMTVQKALDVLRSEGMVVTQVGRGVFVRSTRPERPPNELAELAAKVEDLAGRVSDLEAHVADLQHTSRPKR